MLEKFIAGCLRLIKPSHSEEYERSIQVYPSTYRVKSLSEQVQCLMQCFCDLRLSKACEKLIIRIESGQVKLPEGAEGWFVVPDCRNDPRAFGANYSEDLQTVFRTIGDHNDAYITSVYHSDELGSEYLHQSTRTERLKRELSSRQDYQDLLVFPAQFGMRYRGYSGRLVQKMVMRTPGEFSLGAVDTGFMLLTHPDRLINYGDLWVSCPGDKLRPIDKMFPSNVPRFRYMGGKLEFDAVSSNEANARTGAATGFLINI